MVSSESTQAEARFKRILEAAQDDPNILALWLDGSRGKNITTEYSDYDCSMIVRDEVLEEYKARYENFSNSEIELSVSTFVGLRQYAAWGSPEAWDRYNFAHVKALVDKTGEAQRLIDEKATAPTVEARRFIDRALDHYINQVYRSIKCVRDRQHLAARFEAAEAITPLLDAVFALNGRVRPYFKYLEWEFNQYPLAKLGVSPPQFVAMLFEVLNSGDVKVQQTLLCRMESLFRPEGYGEVFDGWGQKLVWMKSASV